MKDRWVKLAVWVSRSQQLSPSEQGVEIEGRIRKHRKDLGLDPDPEETSRRALIYQE